MIKALVLALFLAATGAFGFAVGVTTWDIGDSRGWMG